MIAVGDRSHGSIRLFGVSLIADDRRPYCDLRSAIGDPRSYGNQPLDSTWFYLLRSSAITIAGSQTIADLIAICDLWKPALKAGFHMIADRRSQIADRKQSQLIADDRRR